MAMHWFEPERYFRTLGTHEAVLKVKPGDTVRTTTVDAHGVDAARREVTPSGNPMTGPFFVEGAEPGDTLVVHLEEIRPNRRYGWSGEHLATNVVDPAFVTTLPLPGPGPRRRAEWDVDVETGCTTLTWPETRFGPYALPLRPMLGCFGVAAEEGQAISTDTSGPHGGNMDYRGFVAGVTVYFPVHALGALFFLGDCHAVQGAGEIAGTGIEISSEVTFRVDVQKGRTIRWPRGENAEWIFTVGNARPLDQAVQHATTEMARWLQDDLGYDAPGAQILMGQVVDYELGNMFDPAYTMVCKIEKRWLSLSR